ncbi:hypothetical protein [Gordonia westfalica]|uniref:Uncharacterized protein n=1 Tax=Gordonia westfalica TaxID=158898 RepID=A0A1H2DMB2_9ACTN|nr:hypothetical protein [Gordonia westfalica]SDT84053.1 hypothetical protein SAMN04488548_1062 [Gordonia westfalica]
MARSCSSRSPTHNTPRTSSTSTTSKEAQLLWLRAEIAHYAAKQDSKSVEYALLSILQRSYDIEDEGVDQ